MPSPDLLRRAVIQGLCKKSEDGANPHFVHNSMHYGGGNLRITQCTMGGGVRVQALTSGLVD